MRHFLEDGRRCTCGCHKPADAFGRMLHFAPCCHPPPKLRVTRENLVDWLLKEHPDQQGLRVRMTPEAMALVFNLSEDERGKAEDMPTLFGLPVIPWRADYPAAVCQLLKDGRPVSVREFVP